MEPGSDQYFIEFLNEFWNEAPAHFFEREPTNETTVVQSMNFALRNIVHQLRCPINTESESVTRWLVYKQSGPHRHQKFFGFFRQLNRLLKKYNDIFLIRTLNNVLRKAENCGECIYKLNTVAVRYIGCAYLRRIYSLERIRATCRECANGAIGLLEIEHWSNLCLVVVALCSQVHSEIIKQLIEMEKVYSSASSLLKSADDRFPENLDALQIVRKIKNESRVFDDRQSESSCMHSISRLLRFSPGKIVQAQGLNELKLEMSARINKILNDDMTSESTPEASKQSGMQNQLDLTDLGISISREDSSFLNSTIRSSSTILLKSDDDQNSFLFSPNLFGAKVSKTEKQQNGRKVKSSGTSDKCTPRKVMKTERLPSASSFSSKNKKNKRKKQTSI